MERKIIEFKPLESYFSDMKFQNNEYTVAVTEVQKILTNVRDMYEKKPNQENFNHIPSTYDEITRCYSDIAAMCVDFTDTIYSQLEVYPQNCAEALNRIDSNLTGALAKVDMLINYPDLNPTDKELLVNILVSYMDGIITNSKQQIEFLDLLLKNLNTFSDKNVNMIILNMNTILGDISTESANYKKAKEALEKYIKQLKKDINEQIALVTMSCGVTIMAIITGIVAVAATVASLGTALPIGLTVVGGLIGVGATFFGIGMSSYDLHELRVEVEETTKNISSYEADILTFEAWSNNVEEYKRSLDHLSEELDTIKNAWSGVKSGFTQIKTEIEDSKGNLQQNRWLEIQSSLKNCQVTSNELRTMLEDMQLENNLFTRASLEVDMTAEQVSEALEKAEKLTFKEYMLAI